MFRAGTSGRLLAEYILHRNQSVGDLHDQKLDNIGRMSSVSKFDCLLKEKNYDVTSLTESVSGCQKITTNGIWIHVHDNQRHPLNSKWQQSFNAGQAFDHFSGRVWSNTRTANMYEDTKHISSNKRKMLRLLEKLFGLKVHLHRTQTNAKQPKFDVIENFAKGFDLSQTLQPGCLTSFTGT